jgi:hypothetical protein
MKTYPFRQSLILLLLLCLLGACQPALPTAPVADGETTIPSTEVPTLTPTPLDTQALLQTAVDHFIEAASFQMSIDEIVSYHGIAADGAVTEVYGEFNSTYDVLREPESKLRVQSQFRFSPDTDFTGETYYGYEENGKAYRLTYDAEGQSLVDEMSGQTLEALLGDVYPTLLQYGAQAQFTEQDTDEVIYTLDHPAWYTLQSAVGFADLGFLAMQEDGAELVKDYVEQAYPDVQTVRFILHVSLADQTITEVELDNRAFMLSFWDAYNQALVDQGVDLAQLTRYEIQPEHHMTVLFSSYDQIPDFALPN